MIAEHEALSALCHARLEHQTLHSLQEAKYILHPDRSSHVLLKFYLCLPQDLEIGNSKYARKVAEGLTKIGGCAALLLLLEQALQQQQLQDTLLAMPLFLVRCPPCPTSKLLSRFCFSQRAGLLHDMACRPLNSCAKCANWFSSFEHGTASFKGKAVKKMVFLEHTGGISALQALSGQ